MYEALVGVIFGALITYLLNFLLERRKHDLEMQKYAFDVKRLKLEEMLLLVEKADSISKKMMGYFIQLSAFGNLDESRSQESFTSKFLQLKNYANMYFHDDKKFHDLIFLTDNSYKEVMEINGKVFENLQKNTTKQEMQEINYQILVCYGRLEKKLENINNYLPEIYKNMINTNEKKVEPV